LYIALTQFSLWLLNLTLNLVLNLELSGDLDSSSDLGGLGTYRHLQGLYSGCVVALQGAIGLIGPVGGSLTECLITFDRVLRTA
jgi:hypothetical protein